VAAGVPRGLLDLVAARQADPAAAATSRETIEIAYVAALQHLPPRQRAALVLRDVLGWPAEQAAATLKVTVAALNSSLQRARARLRAVLEPERSRWRAAAPAAGEEANHVRRFVDAIERADDHALLSILAEEVVVGHQPGAGGNDADQPTWYAGRATVLAAWAPVLHHPVPLVMRMIPVGVNRQPAVATYVRLPGTDHHQAFALNVFRIAHDRITEIATLSTASLVALACQPGPGTPASSDDRTHELTPRTSAVEVGPQSIAPATAELTTLDALVGTWTWNGGLQTVPSRSPARPASSGPPVAIPYRARCATRRRRGEHEHRRRRRGPKRRRVPRPLLRQRGRQRQLPHQGARGRSTSASVRHRVPAVVPLGAAGSPRPHKR
jgi:Sigma-70, region 4/SnoaL-like domain